ncbi:MULTISPECIES: hypothetical protein [unclassified Streptomyces]|uniref:hypothetical protein n=1 Tax=unclassified Streptomyces TaxID=2593676 RepID=UPI0013A6AD1B|nr:MULTISPECIES: hypothetical protein [unclassified Streptomyces]QZZ27996.1 hypothetical protein A7X85_18425 [Streptomyces sp. ST1015]
MVLGFNLLMLVWLVAVISATPGATDECGSSETCQAGTEFSAALVAGVSLLAWTAGDVILGVIWLVTNKSSGRAARRPPSTPPPPPPGRW